MKGRTKHIVTPTGQKVSHINNDRTFLEQLIDHRQHRHRKEILTIGVTGMNVPVDESFTSSPPTCVMRSSNWNKMNVTAAERS